MDQWNGWRKKKLIDRTTWKRSISLGHGNSQDHGVPIYIYIPISNREFRLLWLPGGYEVWYLSPMHWWNHATYSTGSQVLLALPGQALHSTEKGREVPIISFNHVGCNTFWTACLQMCVWHLIFAVRTKQFAPTLRALTRYCVDAGPRNELRWAKRSEL